MNSKKVEKKETSGDLLYYLRRHIIISDNKQGTPGLHTAHNKHQLLSSNSAHLDIF